MCCCWISVGVSTSDLTQCIPPLHQLATPPLPAPQGQERRQEGWRDWGARPEQGGEGGAEEEEECTDLVGQRGGGQHQWRRGGGRGRRGTEQPQNPVLGSATQVGDDDRLLTMISRWCPHNDILIVWKEPLSSPCTLSKTIQKHDHKTVCLRPKPCEISVCYTLCSQLDGNSRFSTRKAPPPTLRPVGRTLLPPIFIPLTTAPNMLFQQCGRKTLCVIGVAHTPPIVFKDSHKHTAKEQRNANKRMGLRNYFMSALRETFPS